MREHAAQIDVTLTVNGKAYQRHADPCRSLLDLLRDDLGLTGTKLGCDDGACGTCAVIVNGAIARACRVPIDRANGKDVLTIEGLGTAERLHPLQEAFIAADAVQCGFCTPGMIMAAKALLDRNPTPTRDQIAKALGSNLSGRAGIPRRHRGRKQDRCVARQGRSERDPRLGERASVHDVRAAHVPRRDAHLPPELVP